MPLPDTRAHAPTQVVALRAGADGLVPAGDGALRWSLNPQLLAHLLPAVRAQWPTWSDATDAVLVVQSPVLVNVRPRFPEPSLGLFAQDSPLF